MSVSDRDGDSGTRFRAFYDHAAPVEFEAMLPDDLDGPEDERKFLLDEAPFAKLSAVRVERVYSGASVAAPGRTPAVEGDRTPEGRTDDLRAEAGDLSDDAALVALATVIDPEAMAVGGNLPIAEAMGWMARQDRALLDAHAIHEAGYRLVSEDDTTVDRLAVVLHSAGCGCGMSLDDHQAAMRNDFGEEDPGFAEMARAAVRALREAGRDA